ncbi:MAG: hypothetical protein K2Q45_03150 [Nitrosomonas sp.]|nr:hypothetical protein [Nitrosomonas sp.]
MEELVEGKVHDKESCLKSRHARCRECGTWHPKRKCPFGKVACLNKVHRKATYHRKCLMQKCEICVMKVVISDKDSLICPEVLPRCARHCIEPCFGCDVMIDHAKPSFHECELLIDRLSVEMLEKVTLYSSGVYFCMKGEKNVFLVTDVYKVPPLKNYKDVIVYFICEDEYFKLNKILEIDNDRYGDHDVRTSALFPKAYCACCWTTVQKSLVWCNCRKYLFCSEECRMESVFQHPRCYRPLQPLLLV